MNSVAKGTVYIRWYLLGAPAQADWDSPGLEKTRQNMVYFFFDDVFISSAHVVLFDLNCYDLLYGNTGKSIKQWVWDIGCLICPKLYIELYTANERISRLARNVLCFFLGSKSF